MLLNWYRIQCRDVDVDVDVETVRPGLHDVTLVIPWLAPSEQALVHPAVIFNTPEEQGAYVRQWVKDRCG